jgi:hypothetical protein
MIACGSIAPGAASRSSNSSAASSSSRCWRRSRCRASRSSTSARASPRCRGCSLASSSWTGTINGKGYWLNYGWPDAGDELNARQIDALIDYSGFRAYLVGPPSTRFVRDDAPSPDNCSVTYNDAYYLPTHYQIVVTTTGC